MRPSSVAEPRCGRTTTFGFLSSFGLMAGSCSNTSSAAPPISRFHHPGQRVLVDHFATSRIDDIGRRLHQLQPPRRQQMKCRWSMRTVHGDDVHLGEHLVETLPIVRPQLLLHGVGNTAPVVVVDRETKGFARRATARPIRPMPIMPGFCPKCDGRASRSETSRAIRAPRQIIAPSRTGAERPGSAPWSYRPCLRQERPAYW